MYRWLCGYYVYMYSSCMYMRRHKWNHMMGAKSYVTKLFMKGRLRNRLRKPCGNLRSNAPYQQWQLIFGFGKAGPEEYEQVAC